MISDNAVEGKRWDIVIKSKKKLFSLELIKVWQFRDLLMQLVRRDFIAFYKQTILGPIWFFLQPLFTTLVYVFLFSKLAGISTDGIPAPLFYLSGITAWSYFSECLLKTSTVFRDNANIFGKVYFPRLIMPLSIVVSNLVKFGVQLVLLIIMLLYYSVQGMDFNPSLHILLFPVFIILMAAQGLGLGMLISALTTKYRDLALLLTFGIQLLMYATPIVYPLSSLKGLMYTIISANPMTPIVEGMRLGLFGAGTFTVQSFFYVLLLTILILAAGTIIFNKVERNFVDTI
jgi:lipopolysaccharide transport system permease protein